MLTRRVTLRPFDIAFDCREDETILEAAFRAGVNLRYGCRHGGCGACRTPLQSGEVEYDDGRGSAVSERDRQAGIALLCCARPIEDLELLLEDYEVSELTPEFPPRQYGVTLSAKRMLTPDVLLATFSLEDGERIDFAAGQYVEIDLPGQAGHRAFSFANAPGKNDRVTCMIKLLPDGAFGTFIQRAPLNERLTLRGPFGQFRIAETAADIIMIAGGTGMAPIVSMLADLAASGSRRVIRFYYGARRSCDLFWLEEIAEFASRLPGFTFVPAVADPTGEAQWEGEVGLITDVVDRREPALQRCEAYLCGPPGMIDSAVGILRSHGMFASRIRYDKFLGTG
ncbi:2Fe-2S iron-sulfur cluster-binding protein [Sphingobium herbicidovorans]